MPQFEAAGDVVLSISAVAAMLKSPFFNTLQSLHGGIETLDQ